MPLNDARVVIVPLPLASSKTVPSPLAPPSYGCAVQIAAAVHDQARPTGIAPSVPLNEASVVIVPLPAGELENGAVAVGASRLSVVP